MSLRLHGNVVDSSSSNSSLEHDKHFFVDICRTIIFSQDLPVIVTSSVSGSSSFCSNIFNRKKDIEIFVKICINCFLIDFKFNNMCKNYLCRSYLDYCSCMDVNICSCILQISLTCLIIVDFCIIYSYVHSIP